MNVIFDNFNRYFTGISNVFVQLLQIYKISYMIVMIMKYVQLQKNETEQLLLSSMRILRFQLQVLTFKYPYLPVHIIRYCKYKTHN
jgi:hypothetical protein